MGKHTAHMPNKLKVNCYMIICLILRARLREKSLLHMLCVMARVFSMRAKTTVNSIPAAAPLRHHLYTYLAARAAPLPRVQAASAEDLICACAPILANTRVPGKSTPLICNSGAFCKSSSRLITLIMITIIVISNNDKVKAEQLNCVQEQKPKGVARAPV